jgi:uncharacterized protein (TIGR03435 family)
MRQLVLLLATVTCGSAQSANGSLTFEVASVRVAGNEPASGKGALKSQTGAVGRDANPLRFSRRGVTLARLLTAAYQIPHPKQLIGPEWLNSNAYDIEALAPAGSTPEQQQVMVQNLLIERFAMKLHRETREMPVYELVVAKGGPKMIPSAPNSPFAPLADRPLPTAPRGYGDGTTHLAERGTMEQFAARLTRYVDRPIVDRTGLKGEYDVTLRWTPGAQAPPPVAADAPDPGLSIFSAVQTQLGLKLDAKRGPVEVVVVDHLEKIPTEN